MEFHVGDRVITDGTVSYRFRNMLATIVHIELNGRVRISFDDIDNLIGAIGWGASTSCLKLVSDMQFEDNKEINEFINSF